MSNSDDLTYIRQVIDGDNKAFAALIDRYKDMVFTLSLKMVKSREEAEEIAQDTFIKVYRSLNKFKGESKFSTWLYKVAYNNCLDCLKKNKRTQDIVSMDEYTENQLQSLDSAVDSLETKERQKLIQLCLNILPGEDSFLLTLFYFEEQSVKEIAKIMGINENHVKIKLYRSRKKLATVLKARLTPEILNHYESEQR